VLGLQYTFGGLEGEFCRFVGAATPKLLVPKNNERCQRMIDWFTQFRFHSTQIGRFGDDLAAKILAVI